MADQDEDDQEIVHRNYPNAGAKFKVPESAAISCKWKLNVNSGKYRRELGSIEVTTVKSKMYAWNMTILS